jgi:hypothetical protein
MKKGRFPVLAIGMMVLSFWILGGLVAAQKNPGDTVRSITLPGINIELRAGAGKDKTVLHCSICHSLDYITNQPGFPAERWAVIVQKMIRVYGAPLNEEETKVIVDYLGARYGPEK